MKLVWVVAILLIAALVFYVANRLSNDTIAFALGVVFGVLAAVPCSILVIAANRGSKREPTQPMYPPMMIMGGGYDQGGHQYSQQPPAPPMIESRVVQVQNEYREW